MADKTLDEILEGLKTAFTDLTTVEVLTFTGTVDQVLTQPDGDGARKINWKDLSQLKGVTEGTLKLAAATRVDIDYDIINFRRTDLDDDLRELHNESVATSLEARRKFLDMFVKRIAPG